MIRTRARWAALLLMSPFFTTKLPCRWLRDNSDVDILQDEPNQNPYLPAPKRNPAPYQVLSGGLAFLGMLGKLKWIILIIIILAATLPFLGPAIITAIKSSISG